MALIASCAHRLHLLEDSATPLLLVSCTHWGSGQGGTATFLLRFLRCPAACVGLRFSLLSAQSAPFSQTRCYGVIEHNEQINGRAHSLHKEARGTEETYYASKPALLHLARL